MAKKLVELMYEHNVGVTSEKRFEIKQVNSDYFEAI